jgi:hypothetical protein
LYRQSISNCLMVCPYTLWVLDGRLLLLLPIKS